MRHPVIHRPRAWRTTTWGLLALLLVVAQMLGQWHALGHTGGNTSPFATAQHSHAHGQHAATQAHDSSHALPDHAHHAADADWLGALFSDHHQLDCRVLDHLASGSAPGFASAPWLADVPRAAQVALWRAPAVSAESRAAFQARAPPLRA